MFAEIPHEQPKREAKNDRLKQKWPTHLTLPSICNVAGHAIHTLPRPIGFSGAPPVINQLSGALPVVRMPFVFYLVFRRRCLPWRSIEAKRMPKSFIQPLMNAQGKHFLGKTEQNMVGTPVKKQGPKMGIQWGCRN